MKRARGEARRYLHVYEPRRQRRHLGEWKKYTCFQIFFFLLFLDTHARTRRLLLPSSVRPFFFYARRSSGGEQGAGSQREEDDDDDDGDDDDDDYDSPESSGSSGRAECNIRRLPRRGGRRIIQNYLVFSLSSSFSASSFFFLLSPLALGSVSCAARNSVKAWRGFKNKQGKKTISFTLALKVIRGYLRYAHNSKSVRSRSSLKLRSAPSVYLRGIPTPCTGHFWWWEPLPMEDGKRKNEK